MPRRWWLTHAILATQEADYQEDCGSKPAWATGLKPYLKNSQHKKGLANKKT
jgi:hypothetical protein